MIDQHNEQYEDNLLLWRKYSRLGEELGAIINEPVEEHDPEQYIFRGGHWILIGEDYD